ncbi:MAG: M20 family metallopeptidase [Pseudobdellovibrionaceae bacterium]
MDFIEACRKIISLESTPENGNKEVAEFASDLCRQQGMEVEIFSEYSGDIEQANIIARFDKTRPMTEFLLQNHLDTVSPGPYQLWEKTGLNPFDSSIEDGRIYGLGAAEVKLDFICKLQALSHFKNEKNWKLPPVLLGTFGEESGMQGALKVIRKNLVSPKMALIAEPSNMNLIYAGKGHASVEILIHFSQEEMAYRQEHRLRESTATQSKFFHGKAAHSSTPESGESAIKKMLDYVQQLPDNAAIIELDGGTNHNTVPSHALLEIDLLPSMQFPILKKINAIHRALLNLEKEFVLFQDTEFTPSHPTLNIGLIRTYDDHILFTGSCRIPPIITHSIYEAWMEDLRQLCEKNQALFRILDYKKPFRTSTNSILVKGCMDELKTIHPQAQLMTQASTNEASLFSRLGIDCVCFGPGERDGNIHTPFENVKVDDLHKSVLFYKQILQRFCL